MTLFTFETHYDTLKFWIVNPEYRVREQHGNQAELDLSNRYILPYKLDFTSSSGFMYLLIEDRDQVRTCTEIDEISNLEARLLQLERENIR